jgi:hypothetical protein
MKTVRFSPDLKEPSKRRLCNECPVFTEIRCIICRDYTCRKCIETDTTCSTCFYQENTQIEDNINNTLI